MRSDVTLPVYLLGVLSLLAASFLVFQVIVKRAYLRRGSLGAGVAALQLLPWGAFFTFPYLYSPPDWAWFWTHAHPAGPVALVMALVLLATGLGFLVVAMAQLGSSIVMGGPVTTLHAGGLYGLTRNPQIVAGFPLVAGLGLLWPSWYALGWVASYVAMAHMMVLAEEAHLRHRQGQSYERYCARVPRYVRFGAIRARPP